MRLEQGASEERGRERAGSIQRQRDLGGPGTPEASGLTGAILGFWTPGSCPDRLNPRTGLSFFLMSLFPDLYLGYWTQ